MNTYAFTKKSKQIIAAAEARAKANGQTGVVLEDILYALMRTTKGPVAKVMKKLGLCNQLPLIYSTAEPVNTNSDGELPLTDEVVLLLDHARGIATTLNSKELRPYHLLWALVTCDNTTIANILRKCGTSGEAVSDTLETVTGKSTSNEISKDDLPQLMLMDPMKALQLLSGGQAPSVMRMKSPRPPRRQRVTETTMEVTHTKSFNPAVVLASRWDDAYSQIVTKMLENNAEGIDADKIVAAATKVADGLVAGIKTQLTAFTSDEVADEPSAEKHPKQPAFQIGDPVVTMVDWGNDQLTDIPEFKVTSLTFDDEANVWLYTIASTDQTPEVIKTLPQDELVEKTVAEVEQRERQNQTASNSLAAAPSQSTDEAPSWQHRTEGGAVGTLVYVLAAETNEIRPGQEQSRVTAERYREVDDQGNLEHEYQVNNGGTWWPSSRIRTVEDVHTQAAPVAAGDSSVVSS